MKRILAFILATALMLCACGGEPPTVKLSIDSESVTPTGLSYTVTLEGNGKLSFKANDYYLEHNEGGAWSEVQGSSDTQADAETAVEIEKGSAIESIDWTSVYGELAGGIYKLHLYVTVDGEVKNLTCDFEIIGVQAE